MTNVSMTQQPRTGRQSLSPCDFPESSQLFWRKGNGRPHFYANPLTTKRKFQLLVISGATPAVTDIADMTDLTDIPHVVNMSHIAYSFGGTMGLAYVEKHPVEHTVDELVADVVKMARDQIGPDIRHAKIEIDQLEYESLVNEMVQLIGIKLEDHLSAGQKAGLRMRRVMNKRAREGEPTEEWLSREQAAKYLCMSRGTLNKMMEGKKLLIRTQEVGNRRYLLTKDVIRIKQNTLTQLDPIKSKMVREAEDMGLYDIPANFHAEDGRHP